MTSIHAVENIYGSFVNPTTPEAGALKKGGSDTHLEITVIASNPMHSCNYKLLKSSASEPMNSIVKERDHLISSAKKGGYSGIAQIADYITGHCVTFAL